MQLYILRHGIAYERNKWPGDEAARPLTEEGRKRARLVIEVLVKEEMLEVDHIWSSPLARALETAQIAGEVLKRKVKVVEELACGASLPGLLAAFWKSGPLPKRLMLVGHEPDCGAIIGELVGDPDGDYALKKSGIALLRGDFEAGGMTLQWRLAPKEVCDK